PCVGGTSERLEPAGLGAAFLEVSGLAEPLDALATALRDRVSRELGLPLRTGAAPVKFVARLAAGGAGRGGSWGVAPPRKQRGAASARSPPPTSPDSSRRSPCRACPASVRTPWRSSP